MNSNFNIYLILFVSLILASCVSNNYDSNIIKWTHKSKDISELENDRLACIREYCLKARQIENDRINSYIESARKKGYGVVVESDQPSLSESNIHACLYSKGWDNFDNYKDYITDSYRIRYPC